MSRCFKCNKRGTQTKLSPPNSFCCNKCGVWWVNVDGNKSTKELQENKNLHDELTEGGGCFRWVVIALLLTILIIITV